MIKLGPAYKRKTGAGPNAQTYICVPLNDRVNILIFVNDRRRNESDPPYWAYLSEREQQSRGTHDRQAETNQGQETNYPDQNFAMHGLPEDSGRGRPSRDYGGGWRR